MTAAVDASVIEFGPRLAVVLVLLVAPAGHWSGPGQGRPALLASVRATLQLAG
jgi:hypothetical protein